ncbi:hypothetical protein Tco_0952152 [Tanacetum coccineum]|uniref:Uncharacterized protein n=1 Tax=Tanacetum coccineum TaxID=301880 RepID=A0ABQ5DWB2_9ASTR
MRTSSNPRYQAIFNMEGHLYRQFLGRINKGYVSTGAQKHCLQIFETHVALSVTDTEETLELAEESRLKMLANQNDPSLKEKKVNIAPVDYVALNKLSEHFVKQFVPQKLIVCRKAFDKKYFEIEKKELSLDNDRLLEHIICKDIMNTVMHANDHYENVLHVNNNSLVYDNSAIDPLKHENDRLMELLISQDLVHTAVNSLATINDYKSMEQCFVDEYEENLKLQTELATKNDMIEKAAYNELSKQCSRLENRCISLEIKLQQNKESFQNNRPSHNQDAPEFKDLFKWMGGRF